MNPARILVVDDAATVRLYHRKLLSDAGWEIEEAINGLEALERVVAKDQQPGFDLYVVDVNMPKLDGYGFVRELRQLTDTPAAPVLMVSTESQRHDMVAALDAGANAYLIKPAQPLELLLTAALLLGDATAALQAARSAAARASAAPSLKRLTGATA